MEGQPSDENLVFVDDPSETSVLYSIQQRFERKRIYTRIGDNLIVLNPHEKYPIYDNSVLSQYKGENSAAHIFAVARDALNSLKSGSDVENIIFSGESGAGKSFNAHHAMTYLASQEGSKISVQQIDALQTIFNSFASAKTPKNDSATRFGYCADFLYKNYVLAGLSIRTTTPLEVVRVVLQKPGERNFNVFYEVAHGLGKEQKASMGMKEDQRFFYLNQGKVQETATADRQNFGKLETALEVLGFTEEQRALICKTVVAVLHLGNIFFKPKRTMPNQVSEGVEVGNESEVKWTSYLLEVNHTTWAQSFVQKTTKTEEGNSSLPYDMGQALDARDALAQMIYEELFNWILCRLTHNLRCRDATATITVADLYGYEKYNNNGLEQLFINTVNEKLNNVFVKQSFYEATENYIREGVHAPVENPANLDNAKAVELLMKKPYGLLNLLDDEAKFPKGSDESYLQHCTLNHSDKSLYGKARGKDRLEFCVRHFSGSTWYSVHNFVHLNKRTVSTVVVKLLAESQNSLISMLFRPVYKENMDHCIFNAKQVVCAANVLAEKLLNGSSRYVLCAKSNNERQPARFDLPTVSRQLKSLSVNDLLQFRLRGYPIRIPFTLFTQKYRCLLPSDIAIHQKQKEIIVDILEGQGEDYSLDYKIGRNYVFLRDRLYVKLTTDRERIRKKAEIVIQKTLRAYAARKKYLKLRSVAIVLQAGLRGWKARKMTCLMKDELINKLGLPSRRNRRLEAYHMGLNDPTEGKGNPAPTTMTDYLDVSPEANQAIERATSRMGEALETKMTTKYLPSSLKNRISLDPITMEQFAEQNYRGHLLEVRREPIMTPFLPKDNDLDFRMSLEIFKLILKYMNDVKLKPAHLDDLARYIVQQGIINAYQRDEIYVQVCNQTYKNKDKVATERGYRLLQMCLSCFPPTENVIPMIAGFFESAPTNVRLRLEDLLQKRLKVRGSQTARQLPPSLLELAAFHLYQSPVVNVLSYENEDAVEAHSWMTTADVANRVLRHRGIGDPSGWTIEFEKDDKIISCTGNHFFHDALAELDHGKPENKRETFLTFSTERTVPPMNKKKPVPEKAYEPGRSPVERRKDRRAEKPMSPLAERRQRRASGNRSRDCDSRLTGDLYDAPVPPLPTEISMGSESMEKDKYKDDDYTYTSIQKKEKPRSRHPSGVASTEIERFKPYEVVEEKPPVVAKSPTPVRAPPPGFGGVRPSLPLTEPPAASTNYSMYAPQPIIQYVPVMMQPQMMQMNMGAPPMIVNNPAYGYAMPSAPQPSYSMDPNNATQQMWGSSANNSMAGYAIVENDRHPEQNSRMQKSHAPIDYSGLSVASRIRRMPVPEHNQDVDRFLDEVFDQVLSPEELRNSSATPQQIAASIKGGVYGPEYDMPPVASYHTPNQTRSSNGYNTVDDPNRSGRYDYIERVNRSYDSPRSRAKSLPRVDPNISQRSNGYSQIREASADTPSRRRENFPTISAHDPSIKYPLSPVPPVPMNRDTYHPGYSQPTVVMMPVEIHENGQMIPIMDHNQSLPHVSRKSYPAQPGLMRRRFSYEHGHELSPVPAEVLETRTLQRRAVTPSSHRFDSPNMRAVLQQHRPQPPVDLSRTPSKVNGSPKTASPVKSPLTERKTLGLARVPVEQYADPVIQNTVSNSERLNPNKFKVPERGKMKEAQAKEREAVRRLNERMKNLPPPVEQVRVFRPKPPPYVPPPPPQPQPIYEPEPLEVTIPDEPRDLYFPLPEEPEPIYVHQEQEMPPQTEWVFEGEVDRPPELQERFKGELKSSPLSPVFLPPVNGVNGTLKAKEEKPAVKYVKQPWKLTIRKEMFLPHEELDDAKVIDQVFAQIIDDCRRAIAYRIRAYERDDVVQILKHNNIPPDMLGRQHEIPTSIKAEIVEAARKWPLYFSQIYEVVEERADESVSVLLSIGEHGIRLLLHTPLDKENPLKIQDHLIYPDIVEATLENDDTVCIHARSGISIRVRTPMAGQISEQIEKCLYGATRKRQFVRAIADYITTQANLLSFHKGEIIEIVGQPDGEETSDAWLYGKIGNRYGNLPSQYVVPLDDHSEGTVPPPLPLIGDDISNSEREQNSFHGYLDDIDEFGGRGLDYGRSHADRYNMMEYAMKYFRVPKGYDTTMRRGKKQWTWQEVAQMVKWTDKCISHSLLRLETTELDKLAVDAFKCIMMYMGDESIKRGESVTDVVYRLLYICNKHAEMKDEVYCQIIKQTTNNKSNKPNSWIRGWRLFVILTAYYDCSLSLKPFLLTYLADNAEDQRRAFHGTARICMDNLKQTFQHGGRKYLLGAKEVEEVTNGKNLRRQTYGLPGGHKKMINTRIVTVAEEIIQEICNEMNVRSPAEQQEFSLCFVTEKDNRIEYCSNGDYVLDVCTEMDHKKQPFQFVLRRSVWVHPLRLDNPIFIDVMFFQLLPDYLLGFFVNMANNRGISASMTDDIIQMAALIHLAANNGRQTVITSKSIQALIPGPIMDQRIMHPETWVDRINRRLTAFDMSMSPIQARAAFLDVLSRWPLFGSTKFELDSISSDSSHLPQLALSIGKAGVSLIAPRTHRVFEEFPYDKVVSCSVRSGHRGNVMELVVRTSHGDKTYELMTPDATTASRLLQQYKFVVQENEGLL